MSKQAPDQFKSGWNQGPGVCGAGSEDQYINVDANEFAELMADVKLLGGLANKIKVNEAGCGDLYWLRNHWAWWLYFVDYQGYELQPREIHPLCKHLAWQQLDIVREVMRPCDLILSRLVFIHLSNEQISQALNNFRKTGAKYLVCSHFDGDNEHRHDDYSYVGLNYDLSKAPFNLKMVRRTSRNALFVL